MSAYTTNNMSIRTWNSGTTCNTFEGGSTYIPGIIHMETDMYNTWGAATTPLQVPVNIRYWDGFATNTTSTYRMINEGTATSSPYIYYNLPGYLTTPQKTLEHRIKELLRQRIAPPIYTHAKPLGFTKDLREIRARETLHRVLGDDKYKSFLKKGFISVMAKSGLVYQIFPGLDFTKVYNRGIMVDRCCVVLQGGFPPTDSLIMRYLLILNNEKMFESFAIKHGPIKIVDPSSIAIQDNRSLLEIFKEQKRLAA
jgi:hypothetical protein